jgi:cardiolipin synthase
MRQVGNDNTSHLITRPVSAANEAAQRTTTLASDTLKNIWLRSISFPLLSCRDIPELDPARKPMKPAKMKNWLNRHALYRTRGSIELYDHGERFFDELAQEIDSAQRRIDIKTYIFDNDDVAKEVADQLKQKSEQLPVRIQLDALGCRRAWKTTPDSAKGLKMPYLPDMISYLQQDSAIDLRRARHTLLASEHAKFILIDDTAYFGGMNIGREYKYDWRDAMFKLEGPVTDNLAQHFDRAWMLTQGSDLQRWVYSWSNKKEKLDNPNLYLIETTPTSKEIYKAQLRAIKKARHHIYIENPYLWNQSIIFELCKARKRGIDVRVTVPKEVNITFGASATRAIVNRLLKHGVRVFVYPGMTHVKAAVFDQWACAGSANFDYFSLKKNFELNFMTRDPKAVKMIEEELLLKGQQRATELTEAEDRTLSDAFSERLFQLL